MRRVPQDLSRLLLLFLPSRVIRTSCSGQLTVPTQPPPRPLHRIPLVNFLRQDYISSVTYYRPSHVLSRDGGSTPPPGKKKFEKKRTINVILTKRNKSRYARQIINTICWKCNSRKYTVRVNCFSVSARTVRVSAWNIFARRKTLRSRTKFLRLRKTDVRLLFATLTANVFTCTREMCVAAGLLFARIFSAAAAVAYYSYLRLKRYARALRTYVTSSLTKRPHIAHPSTRWDGTRWPLVPRMILPRAALRKRVKDHRLISSFTFYHTPYRAKCTECYFTFTLFFFFSFKSL